MTASVFSDTIAAIATPPGRGGIGVVRVSGPKASEIAQHLLQPQTPLLPRHAYYGPFFDKHGALLDQGIALYFKGPFSFTGEDVLELQGHGGPVVMQLILQAVLVHGARLARPGEFQERAFLNDKCDLVQAEAVADLINASTEQAARSAVRSLTGAFSDAIHQLTARFIDCRMYVESAIDFSEENIDFLQDDKIKLRVKKLCDDIDALYARAEHGCMLRDGLTVVIAGKPNAGKSSLLNQLSGQDVAIVTDVPGTTRDVLHSQIHLDGVPLNLFDTAGLRVTEDAVEAIGVERAYQQIEQADIILLVVDAATPNDINDFTHLINAKTIIIRNKIDLLAEKPCLTEVNHVTHIGVSAKTGMGVPLLKAHLKQVLGVQQTGEDTIIARRRHLDALARVKTHLQTGLNHLQLANAYELFAEECRLAQLVLNDIIGEFTSEDLLSEIFSRFCIGK